jgi:hypothetical protein
MSYVSMFATRLLMIGLYLHDEEIGTVGQVYWPMETIQCIIRCHAQAGLCRHAYMECLFDRISFVPQFS